MPELTELDKAASSEPTKVELVGIGSATDSDSDETIPELEDPNNPNVSFPGTVTGLPLDMVSKAKQSRGEKKARKLMSKLGLKPVYKLLNILILLIIKEKMSCAKAIICFCFLLYTGARSQQSDHSQIKEHSVRYKQAGCFEESSFRYLYSIW